MRFRLVPKPMTFDDLELLYFQIFSQFCATSHTLRGDLVSFVLYIPKLSRDYLCVSQAFLFSAC